MPLLLYGVTESAAVTTCLPPGVGGAIVQCMEVSGFSCFYSENSTLAPENTRESALEFHRVVNSLFEKTDIIPFRYPTLLLDRAEVEAEIEKHSAEFRDGLAKIRGRVQIEIRISPRGSQKEDIAPASASSGAAYLRARYDHHLQLKSAADVIRAGAGELIQRWREREYSDHLRCFALIARGSYATVQAAIAGVVISSDLLARVSGPWPAAEFLKEE